MRMTVYLLEDKEEHAEMILRQLNKRMLNQYGENIRFEWLREDSNRKFKKNYSTGKEETYYFYTQEIIKKIEEKKNQMKEKNGEKMGILLDLLLTEKDFDDEGRYYYPKVKLAKEIFFKYDKILPVYIVTSIPSFGIQCDMIMGEDLSDRYVLKSKLKDNESDSVERVYDYFCKELG